MALKLKSNNSQGNPYHDEEGKFTSKGGEGTGGSGKSSDPLMDLFGSLGKSMRDSEAEEKEAMKMFGLKGDEEKKELKETSEEEKQASKLFGTDLFDKKSWEIDTSDPEMAQFLQLDYKGRNQAKKEGRLPKQFEKLDQNTISSLLAGYDESVMDAPNSVRYTEYYGNGDIDGGEADIEVDVSTDDVIDFIKWNHKNLSPEDEQLIRDNHVVPTRILKEEFGEDFTEEDLEEYLTEWKKG